MYSAGSFSTSFRAAIALLSGAAFVAACVTEAPSKRKKTPIDPPDSWYEEGPGEGDPTIEPALVNDDSGAFGAGERPASNEGGLDAGGEGGPVTKVPCLSPPGPGDLAIVEILISSRSGAGDTGEWVEVVNMRECWLDVKGVTVESPRGASAPNVATVDTDLELAPGGTFVVADSADSAKNYALPGAVFAWNATDVLKNDGDTISVKLDATVIDSLTYPSFNNLTPGRALAFPHDCAANLRSNWERWSLTFDERTPGQLGTPNAPNDDVACF